MPCALLIARSIISLGTPCPRYFSITARKTIFISGLGSPCLAAIYISFEARIYNVDFFWAVFAIEAARTSKCLPIF